MSRICTRAYQYCNLHDVHIQTRMSVCKHHVCVLYMCKLNDLVYTGKKKGYFDILPLIHFVRLIMNLTEDNKHFKIMGCIFCSCQKFSKRMLVLSDVLFPVIVLTLLKNDAALKTLPHWEILQSTMTATMLQLFHFHS